MSRSIQGECATEDLRCHSQERLVLLNQMLKADGNWRPTTFWFDAIKDRVPCCQRTVRRMLILLWRLDLVECHRDGDKRYLWRTTCFAKKNIWE